MELPAWCVLLWVCRIIVVVLIVRCLSLLWIGLGLRLLVCRYVLVRLRWMLCSGRGG